MINNISWTGYGYFIVTITFIYYLFVALLYYRQEIQQRFFALKRSGYLSGNEIGTQRQAEDSQPDLLAAVHLLMDGLTKTIARSKSDKLSKSELIYALQIRLADYDTLVNTPFQQTINDFIANESSKQCSIHLEADELSVLWKR